MVELIRQIPHKGWVRAKTPHKFYNILVNESIVHIIGAYSVYLTASNENYILRRPSKPAQKQV